MFLFPAFLAPTNAPVVREPVLDAGEASCFYHPQSRAVAPCDHCGRYLCDLCRIDWGAQTFCPACVQTGQTSHTRAEMENRRMLYDSIALAVSTFPLLLFYFTLLSAPATLFIVWRYWNAPTSLLPRTRVRFVIAAIIAVLEIAGWIALVLAIIWALQSRTRPGIQ